ncbi:MAG: hypothetical protein GEU74_16815 [Nitriliruptorales bacterium]|nr:hypothetical protein [Nitriliruptorales bacterium]
MTIVGVAGRGEIPAMAEFVARHQLDHIDHVADVDGAVWDANRIGGQPAWVFVDGESGTSKTTFGALGVAGLDAAIDELVG